MFVTHAFHAFVFVIASRMMLADVGEDEIIEWSTLDFTYERSIVETG